MKRVFSLIFAAVFGACAAVPDVAPPLDAATPPLPVLGPRIAALADGETSSYAARLGPLRVATLTYTVRRMLDGGRPLLVVDGVTRMEGVASVLAHAGGTLRTVIEPSTFLPRTSMWTTAADPPKSRAISFDPSQGRAVAAAWTRDWIATTTVAGSRLLDPLTGVWVLRVLAPPPDGEHRALVVEGTNVHLLTYRRSDPPESTDTPPPERWTVRSDEVDPATGRLRGTPPKTLITVDIDPIPPHRILRLEGRMAFGAVRVALEPSAASLPSR